MRTFLGTLFLRIAVAFALLYPAIAGFIEPDKWTVALPAVITQLVAAKTVLIILAAYEILFALLILLKPDPGWVAGIVFVVSIVLTVLNLKSFDTAYPNVVVALSALSLAFFGKIRG